MHSKFFILTKQELLTITKKPYFKALYAILSFWKKSNHNHIKPQFIDHNNNPKQKISEIYGKNNINRELQERLIAVQLALKKADDYYKQCNYNTLPRLLLIKSNNSIKINSNLTDCDLVWKHES